MLCERRGVRRRARVGGRGHVASVGANLRVSVRAELDENKRGDIRRVTVLHLIGMRLHWRTTLLHPLLLGLLSKVLLAVTLLLLLLHLHHVLLLLLLLLHRRRLLRRASTLHPLRLGDEESTRSARFAQGSDE